MSFSNPIEANETSMRLVSFFVLSLALHTAALVYPISFSGREAVRLIPVTLLAMEQESSGAGDSRPGNIADAATGSKRALRASRPVRVAIETKPTGDPAPKPIPNEISTPTGDSNIIASTPATVNRASTVDDSSVGVIGNGANGAGTSAGVNGGNGLGVTGIASGNDSGKAAAGQGTVITQARYRDTPRPDYPESARREGHQGRVLLRVLVDDQGRAKTVEINNSSGSAALDHAAAETLRRWRFHPARYGNQPVESWLRIPIEFRLADAKSW